MMNNRLKDPLPRGPAAPWWRRLYPAGAHHGVRLAMFSMLLLAALLSVLQAWQARHDEAARSVDAGILSLAGEQSMLSQRIARGAALLAAADRQTPTDALRQTLGALLRQAQDGADRLEDLLGTQGALGSDSPPGLLEAVSSWQSASEQLWFRGYAVLGYLDAGASRELRQALAALQGEADQALFSTQTLAWQLQGAAEQRGQAVTRTLQAWCALSLLLMLALAVGVAEPTARAVRRHQRDLLAQRAELERLALVAERTTNSVMIMDAQRHITWVNESFTRLLGYSAAEALGRRAGELLTGEGSDPQTVARRRQALDHGQGIRVEVRIRTRDGRDTWIDEDVQPLRDERGRICGFIAVQSDITEQVNQRLQLSALLAALPVGVVVQERSGEIVQSNPAAQAMLGLECNPAPGRPGAQAQWRAVRDDLTPYEPAEHPAMRTLHTGQALHGESMGLILPGGEQRWMLLNTEPLTDAFGSPAGVVSCFIDVTAQRAQSQLLELTVEGAGVGTWQWDIATGHMACNDRFASMLGYQRGQIGMQIRDWTSLVHPQDWPLWKARVQAHMANPEETCQGEIRIRHARGHWAWILASGRVVARDPQGRPQRMSGIHLDMSERKTLEDRLRQRARTDALTQLPNRVALIERVQHAISRARSEPDFRFAVLFLDLDRFKQVNDTLGHSVGDEMLRQMARRLQAKLRAEDSLMRSASADHTAARIGGDEFVVLLEGIRDPHHAQDIAQRLVEVLSQPYQLGAHEVHSSASIGVVLSGQEQESAESVLRDADIAMYEAKRAGRGRSVRFEPSMHLHAARAMAIESDLRHALAHDELFVVYQPIVSLDTHEAIGVEALVRWRHPQRGLVMPGEFIPIAEESGLIGELGSFVLRQACEQFARWQHSLGASAPRMLSVNLSRAQLRRAGLAREVGTLLQSSGVAAQHLQLEITESLAAQDASVQASLGELKALGISLALDDFGTGYSSLSCLHQLPIDTVKIDRSFVKHALTSEYHRVLIEATIRVAQTLGLRTVAEGIETPGEAALLHSLHCDKGQGYLYSKPLAAEDFAAWLGQPRWSGPATPVPALSALADHA